MKAAKDNRPKNLNLLTIRLPINAVVSILHRMAGVLLFLLLPAFSLYALQQSLASEAQYLAVGQLIQHWLMKSVLIIVAWAFFHHFYAGIRHLLQDVHWMTSLQKARFSGRVVLWMVLVSVALFAWKIW